MKKRAKRVHPSLNEANFAEEARQHLVHHGADDDASLVRVRSLCVDARSSATSAGHAHQNAGSQTQQIKGVTSKRTQVRWT